ncbi:hypothetical protein BX600DRAFT_429956 [Xylariales sp. PMI_506]|nr:hypothetical protein BX600DRAFT_429956 [Xylariales sp. PMI_506]
MTNLPKLLIYIFLCIIGVLTPFGASLQLEGGVTVPNATIPNLSPLPIELFRRALPSGTCDIDTPCVDSSCCDGQSGYCGLDAVHCDPSVCIHNCTARAACGSWATIPGTTCPLNVCCNTFGNCGTTSDFCDTGAPTLCQSNCEQPGPVGQLGTADVQSLVIGYVESWVLTGVGSASPTDVGCAARLLSWLPIDSITHLNVAFGYIDPDTYTVVPIPDVDVSVFQYITNLKLQAPGLQIWLSLGGWTFNDDGPTQPVFGDLASTAVKRQKFISNLASFMREWGFDGVDIDWEYPGAPDRGGSPNDTANYVSLLSDIRLAWDTQYTGTGLNWGLSFTAPTSYWYLQWFDIGNMTVYADWINFMTYDLHGQWDSPADSIGSYIYAHTNLTEIALGLDLLWRNSVPASKVNLGIGFYGRTYTLTDPTCILPGCPFTAGGLPGLCTQTEGYLSYDEISGVISRNNYTVQWDKVAGVKYFAYGDSQWLSYDDSDTLQQKVKFANDNGLRGLFVWAIDQDDSTHDALNALLYPDGLGKFATQNGIGSGSDFGSWTLQDGMCYFGACSDNPTCGSPGFIAIGDSVRCDNGQRQALCCPINAAPDPATCEWVYGFPIFCSPHCDAGELLIAQNKWYYVENPNGDSDAACAPGYFADYCCQATSESIQSSCTANTGVCISIDTNTNLPATNEDASNACPSGNCDISNNYFMPWCCASGLDTSSCTWVGGNHPEPGVCSNPQTCPSTAPYQVGSDTYGDNLNCFSQYTGFEDSPPYTPEVARALCCEPSALSILTNNLPVDLDNIFPTDPPDSNANTWKIEVDTSLSDGLGDTNANDNSFGWYIISGPPDEVSTMDKRDGSDWHLYGCDSELHENRRTVQAVCTKEWNESNCDEIFWGDVATTVIKMPKGCGPGKYAVAVSMEPAKDQIIPRYLGNLRKKVRSAIVYDLTFDYDFSPIVKRADSNKLIRIDYSDDPGYWANIVAAPPDTPLSKRDEEAWAIYRRDLDEHAIKRRELQREVDRDHGGSWERFLDHRWSLERRQTQHHELDELHKRWFSATLTDWITALRHIDTEYELIRHSINAVYPYTLFDYSKSCSIFGIPAQQYLKLWANLEINVKTTASLSLILPLTSRLQGDFGDIRSFGESSVLLRTSGNIAVELNFESFGQLSFNSGQLELFGLDNFGATFSIPGIVTIGPNFKLYAQLLGSATLHTEAQYRIEVANWDYTQQYPNQGSTVADGLSKDAGAEASGGVGTQTWHADVEAVGSLAVHLTPVIQFGIVFTIPDVTIANSYVELGVDTSCTLTATVGANADADGASGQACFGVQGAYNVYAQVNAPSIFRTPYELTYDIIGDTVDIVDITENCIDFTIWDGINTYGYDDAAIRLKLILIRWRKE